MGVFSGVDVVLVTLVILTLSGQCDSSLVYARDELNLVAPVWLWFYYSSVHDLCFDIHILFIRYSRFLGTGVFIGVLLIVLFLISLSIEYGES